MNEYGTLTAAWEDIPPNLQRRHIRLSLAISSELKKDDSVLSDPKDPKSPLAPLYYNYMEELKRYKR
jgi:hypothetical protein